MWKMLFSCSFFIQRRFMQQQFLWTMKHTRLVYVQFKKKLVLHIFKYSLVPFQGRHCTHKPGTKACHTLALLLHSTIGSCDVIKAASWWVVLLFGWHRPHHILSHAHNLHTATVTSLREEWDSTSSDEKGSAKRLSGHADMGVGLKDGDVREGGVWPRVAVRFLDGGGVQVKSRKTGEVHVFCTTCYFFVYI